MWTWQRRQFVQLGSMADLVLLSTERWVQRYQSWFPETTVDHLPVGANFDRSDDDKSLRTRLGIPPTAVVLGLFGSIRDVRPLNVIAESVRVAYACGEEVYVLYVGLYGADLQAAVPPGVPLVDAGPLPSSDVSSYFTAMDLYLSPFCEGVSARRGSFLVGLQNGIPTVTTVGDLTGPFLKEQAGRSFAVIDDPTRVARTIEPLIRQPDLRSRLGKAGREFYDSNFSWEHLTARVLNCLRAPALGPAPSATAGASTD
jgi:glycosyltransferase involved in cell wall biosynthesis